jgi:hypothetical protein
MRESDHYDSVFRLGPAERLDPTQPPEPHPAALNDFVRSVRGGILTGAFDIEVNLNVAIEAYFLGPGGAGTRKSDLFSESVLSVFNFERRCSAAVAVCSELLPHKAAELKAGLSELRQTRNAMAHNPCWFSAVKVEAGLVRTIKASVRRGGQTIDEKTIERWNTLVQRLVILSGFLANYAVDQQTPDPDSFGDEPTAI